MDTGGTCVFYQDVETGGAFDYMHSIWAKADTAGKARVMFRKNALGWVPGEGNELDVSLDWKQYQFQRVSGDTFAGIGIEITVATGETVKVTLDEAVVGYNDPVSEQYYCDSIECETSFTARVATTGAISAENYDWINGSATISDTSYFSIPVQPGMFIESPNCSIATITGTTSNVSAGILGTGVKTNTVQVRTLTGGTKAAVAFEITCSRTGADFAAAKAKMRTKVISTGAELFSTDTHTLSFKSTAITSSDPVGTYNTYSYAASSNTKTICGTAPTTAPTKADGFKIYTRAYNAASTCGNPARVEIKIAEPGTVLPTATAEIFKEASSPRVAGDLSYHSYGSSFTSARGALVNSYDPSTGIYTLDLGIVDADKTAAHQIIYSDGTGATSGYLVINAQPAKTTQVMSLSGLEKCEDSYECTDVFSAYVSGTTAAPQNVPWITGVSLTDTSLYTLTIDSRAFSASHPSCTMHIPGAPIADARKLEVREEAGSALPSLKIRTGWTSATADFTKEAFGFWINCARTGADYIGKTAKAVASDQNVRSIGSIGVDIQSVYFGGNADCSSDCTASPCTICNKVGGKITSVTRLSAGQYYLNGIDGTKYNCSGTAHTSPTRKPLLHQWESSSSTTARITSDTDVGFASVTCIGIP